jgi:transcriptional regulator with XRE-family HTH domain
MKDEAVKFGQSLKKIRTNKGMSQGDIARALNVSRGYVSNIENGKLNPTLSTTTRLAEALDVSTDKLFK